MEELSNIFILNIIFFFPAVADAFPSNRTLIALGIFLKDKKRNQKSLNTNPEY